MSSTVVTESGVELSYIDSGVPVHHYQTYTTLFVVHGTVYTSRVFQRVMSLAGPAGVRFVVINRRDYPGSTPLTPEDLKLVTSGNDEEKAAFISDRGIEFASFIDHFIQHNEIPPISEDGKSGGFAIVGWSLGNAVALSAVANLDALPAPAQSRWASHMRGLVLHEAPPVSIGSPLPPKIWSPQIDQSIPEDLRDQFFMQWITSYFEHGDLSTRDLDVISYILPATSRTPTVFNIPKEQLAAMTYIPPASGSDMLFMLSCTSQLNASYKKACFDLNVRRLLPKMKVFAFAGDVTCPFSFPAFWAMEADNEAHGGGMITFKMVKGINHFVHWDDPDLTLQLYMNVL
ncbi:Alpha/Beta hydrolase protein [Trametes punicea]|nr:Alpha/Beta hydrolase protein [Trametes punicea]